MAAPWEKYSAPQAAGPWSKYGAPKEAAPAQPEQRGFFRRVDDAVRGVADTATFGFADEIAAGLGSLTGIGSAGGNYDQNLTAERQRDSEGGWERFGGQVAGVFTNPASRAKTLWDAAKGGAAAGAAYGFGSGEGSFENRRDEAIKGGALGAGAGVLVRGVANKIGNAAAAKTIPSNEQLRKQAEAAYNKAEAAGVIFKPEGVKQLASTIVNDLAEYGFDETMQPGIAAVIRKFQGLDGQNVTLKGLDIVRRVANNAAKVMDNPSQQDLARQVIDRIDDFVANAGDDAVLMGNAKQGSKAIREARDLWGRFRRSQAVDTAAYKAELRAASTGSGGNLQNATKQNIRRMVEKPRGMSKQEVAAAERVVRGTPGENVARLVGKAAPTGVVSGGIGASAGAAIGSAVGGPAGAAVGTFAVPAIGQIAKTIADRMTVKNMERLSQIIRSGGKTAQDLGNLARKGQLDVAGVKRVENVAKSLGLSVPELAAVMEQNMAN
jgi:hypothetical protein